VCFLRVSLFLLANMFFLYAQIMDFDHYTRPNYDFLCLIGTN
jgi:hypothetical protein